MRFGILLTVFLLTSCAGLFHPRWSYIVYKHEYEKLKFKATILNGVEIPDGILRGNLNDTSLASCEYGEILDSIRPGTSRYFVVFKNYLAHGGENEPSDELEIALLFLDNGKIVPEKSIYVHDRNEIPLGCALLADVKIYGNRVELMGHGRENKFIRKEFEFITNEQLNLDSLRKERKEFKKLSSDALK